MLFVDTNSHLTTKLHNFDIKCHSNSESYDQHGFFGTKFRGGQNFLFTLSGFFNKREYSEANCPDLLISNLFMQGQFTKKKTQSCVEIYAALVTK